MRVLFISLGLLISTSGFAQKYLDMIEQGTYSVAKIEQTAEKFFDAAGRGKGTGYKQFQRWLYNAKRGRKVNGVLVPTNDQLKALRKYKSLQKQNKENEQPGFSSFATWQNLGPEYKNATSGWNPGVGRITSIGVDESNLNHYIVGGPNCGVWKTTDNGNNWVNVTDGFQDLNVWSLEISPHDARFYLWGSNSGDMFQSKNGGASWTSINFPGGWDVRRILFHPTDPNVIFAAANNLYKSTNGGASWTMVQSGTGYDIEFKPGDPSVVYYSGTSVYKSTNSGQSFSVLNGGFSSGEAKMMAVTPDDPNILMVLEERGGKFGGLYKSTNSGASFSKIQSSTGASNNYFGYDKDAADDRGQAPRDMDIIINPSNKNEIIIAGIQTWKSTNGGSSFVLNSYWTPGGAASSGVGYCHADIDIMKWGAGKIFIGSDGGIYTSLDNGASYTDKTTGISCREFYRIGVSKTDPNVVTGGSQDNGTSVMRGAGRDWFCWLGADGMESFVDWSNPNKLYGTTQNGSLYKSTNQGNSRGGITKPSGSGAWVTPFEQDPIDSDIIYVGFNEVWKSSNDGGNWTQISNFGGGSLSELKIAPTDNQYIYAAQGSTLRVTKNGGASWGVISPGGSINYIHVSPRDKNRIVAVTSGNVYVSTNAGSTWQNYTYNLPNVTYECAVWQDNDNNGLYVGGLGFVSYIEDGMSQYVDFWDGIPMCSVRELEINYVSNTIFAGTYGRGLWESDLYGSTPVDYEIGINSLDNVPSEVCGSSVSPQLVVKNNGLQTVTSYTIEVYLNDGLVEILNQNTSLNTGASETITISQINYGAQGSNEVKIVLSAPNGQLDEKLSNNADSISTNVEFGTPHLFYVDNRSVSNNFSWEIKDGGSVVKSGDLNSSTLISTQLEQEVCLQKGCYDFVMSDAFNSGGCSTPAWNSSTVYSGDAGLGQGNGEVVSYNGKEYRAQWWTQGNAPGSSNVWLEVGDCNVTYDDDIYGFKEVGENAYFEIAVKDFSNSNTDAFCFGSNLVVDFSANSTAVTNCDDVVFTANVTGGNPSIYAWDFGSGASPATATGIGPHTIKYLSVGSKDVSLTVDGVNESKTGYVSVSLDQSKSITSSIILDNTPACEGDLASFSAVLANEGTNPVYSWRVNDVEVSSTAAFSSSSLENGDKVRLVTIADNECSLPDSVLSNEVIVNLNPLLTPSISISPVSGSTWPICVGGSIELVASTQNGGQGTVVNWEVNGVNVGNGTTYEFVGDNEDTITAVLNSSELCVASNDVVSNQLVAFVDLCTSSNEQTISVETFPNPVVDLLTVKADRVKSIKVLDVNGKQVNFSEVNNEVFTLDMSAYTSGSYLLELSFDSGIKETLEIQKQ